MRDVKSGGAGLKIGRHFQCEVLVCGLRVLMSPRSEIAGVEEAAEQEVRDVVAGCGGTGLKADGDADVLEIRQTIC